MLEDRYLTCIVRTSPNDRPMTAVSLNYTEICIQLKKCIIATLNGLAFSLANERLVITSV